MNGADFRAEILGSVEKLECFDGDGIPELKVDIERVISFCKLNYLIEEVNNFGGGVHDNHDFIHFYLEKLIELSDARNAELIAFNLEGKIEYNIRRDSRGDTPLGSSLKAIYPVLQTVYSAKRPFCTYNKNCNVNICQQKSCSLVNDHNIFCIPILESGQVQYEIVVEGGERIKLFRNILCEAIRTFVEKTQMHFTNFSFGLRKESKLVAEAKAIREKCNFDSIIGVHPKIIAILKLITQISKSDATVLIQGESGTGKEIIAMAIHRNSDRKQYPFVPINCSNLPENLMESELFGYTKGAFTGAVQDKRGWFERAEGGTIFLDEISEMPSLLQAKLLRVLQTGEYSRLGDTVPRYSNVRVVAATNKNLQDMVREGLFREDLFYRLNVIDIELPPLRDRRCDIPLLINHFMKIYSIKYGKRSLNISRRAEGLLFAYEFPGNVRQLENIIHRAVVLAEADIIEPWHLPANLYREDDMTSLVQQPSSFKMAKKFAVEKFEREFITDCLKASRGNISRASQIAGINFKNFYEKMARYRINPNPFKNV